MLKQFLIIFAIPNVLALQCPTNVTRGFICINNQTIGPNVGTDIPLNNYISSMSQINFTGHELSLQRFGQRSIPSETLSCDGATFVEDEIISASNYVSVPLITKTYLDICTDTNKNILQE